MSLQTPGRNRRRILFAVYGAALLYFVLKQCYYIFCVGGFPDQTAHISYLIYAVKFPFRLPDFRAMTMYQYAGETGGLSLFTPLEGVPDYLGHPPLYYWLMSLLGGVRLQPDGSALVSQLRLDLANVVLSSGALVLAFSLGYRKLETRSPLVHALYAFAVASLPMVAYVGASLNNDNLALLAMAVFFAGLLRYQEDRLDLKTYLLLGIGFLLGAFSKLTTALLMVILLLACLVLDIVRTKSLRLVANRWFLLTLPCYLLFLAYELYIRRNYGTWVPGLSEIAPVNGSELEVENTDNTENSDIVVNAPNATVTMDGVYDEVEVTCGEDTLILRPGFHARKLNVKKGNVLIYGDSISEFADEFTSTGTVTPILESGATEQYILETIAAATGTSVQIDLQEGMVVRNLVIPSETNCSPKINGVFANGAIVNFDGPTSKFITLTNTSDTPTDINVKANGTIYFAGKYNNINVDGKGVAVSSSNYALVYGNINIADTVSSVTVSCKFESNERQEVNYNGAKMSVSNSNTANTSNVLVNASNAALTMGGKYSKVEANCVSLTLNAGFFAQTLIANSDVILNGIDINDFATSVTCTGTISPVQFTKLTCSPGESTLMEDTLGNNLAFGAFATGKSKWNLNNFTYTNKRSGTPIVLLRNTPVLNVYGPGKLTTNVTEDGYGMWVSGENAVLNIYGGDYEGYVHCLYAEYGTINVYGGTFKLLDAATADRDENNNLKFLVNCLDASYTGNTAHINIYGGKFYEYNPAVSYSEPNGPVSFVAEGYHVVESTENGVKVYEVVANE